MSLVQPEQNTLDDEAKRCFQAIVDRAISLNQVARAMPKPSKVHKQASTSVPSRDDGFQLQLEARRAQAQRVLKHQLQKQPGQREDNFIVHHDDVQLFRELRGRQGLTAQATMEAEPAAGALPIREAGFTQNIRMGLGFKEEFKYVPLHIDTTCSR